MYLVHNNTSLPFIRKEFLSAYCIASSSLTCNIVLLWKVAVFKAKAHVSLISAEYWLSLCTPEFFNNEYKISK